MSDPNAPRAEGNDPAEQPVDGFAVTDEQHAAPSAPAAPGLGEPAQSFSSPAADPAPQEPSQPAFGAAEPSQDWQHGQQQPAAGQPGDFGQPAQPTPPYGGSAPAAGQQGSAPAYGQPQQGQPGQPTGAPQYGAPQQGQPPYGQPDQPHQGQPHLGQPQYGAPGQPQYGAPGQPQYAASAPMAPVDEKNAGMWGHLSGLSTIVTGGYGGWIGPLIVFLIYKDRSAFAKQESKEALNFGIFMTILTVGMIVLGTILSFVGIGFILLALWWLPGLLQVIFSIIGAVRVNNGGSYRYPFNWRMIS
ncbi:DUF4870 domain-containing protein [Agrococcus sp. ARC_14]|uniref:DUF4870 domain-containing protein n=1 Tax=Agrococcus sp. ARC_14 TaxID=2919927 RepID=UPI001F064AA8|nr:DUF4870 domain-containing protein [Agrococcus sp. ARC_14]MCH1882944.1 DUF4870 domain-containing protein [Agrococcus sp. ARC_14]